MKNFWNEENKKLAKKFLLSAMLYFYLVNVFYLDIGQNMTGKYFVPIFLPMIFFLTTMQFSARTEIFSWRHFPNMFTGLVWCMTFPLLYTWTYEKPWFMSLICYDFLVGTAIFLFLVSVEVLLNSFKVKFSSAIICVLNFLFLVVPFIEIGKKV